MSKPLLNAKIAVLVSNGFNEKDLTAVQRALIEAGANVRLISSEHGLVHSWSGDGWGHHYAVDATLSNALGADYMMLAIPGGSRSMEKLRLTAHTKRFIGSFMAANKPVAVCGDATAIMEHCGFADMSAYLNAACEDDAARKAFAAQTVKFFADSLAQARQAA